MKKPQAINNKEIWHHLCRELAKTNTLIETAQKILKSQLFTRTRYKYFAITILDSYTRVVVLSIYHFFDRNYSWSLELFPDLTKEEKEKIVKLKLQARDYIVIRQNEIGHVSNKIKVVDLSRFKWLPDSELEKTKILVKEIGKFLNAYGQRRFNEGYVLKYDDVDLNLQCLIEDLEKINEI